MKNESSSKEVNYKKDFCLKYIGQSGWYLDVLNKVDVLLTDKKGNNLLYIESKHVLQSKEQIRSALAQTILTNKKQEQILDKVALIFTDKKDNGNDFLYLIDCSDDSVMFKTT